MAKRRDDEDLLKEIRDNFDYGVNSWSDARAEGVKDIKCVAGDPWDPAEREKREKINRPCLTYDEISQYVNQAVNNFRQNPRAIKVIPTGSGANDKTAEFLAGMIRQIEYESNAKVAYATAHESQITRSYGAWKLKTEHISPTDFNQRIKIVRISDPDTVIMDPDAKEADFSDGNWAFHLSMVKKKQFQQDYPSAKFQDFTSNELKIAPKWFDGSGDNQKVQLAEYWRVENEKRDLLLVDLGDGNPQGTLFFLGGKAHKDVLAAPEGSTVEEIEDAQYLVMPTASGPRQFPILKRRDTETRKICQYITNGIEILKKNPWPGSWIPIFFPTGKELWLTEGGVKKRVLMSMVRLARSPAQAYCYYRTCEAEVVGMVPKAQFIGYKGQFAGDEHWDKIGQEPYAYLEVLAQTDETGEQILPLPTRVGYEPPIQAMEMAAESARRGIQAAMGISALPTAAQRQNQKSGVALERIEAQQSQGSFHFLDNLETAIEFTGRQMLELIPIIYDTQRSVGIRGADDKYKAVQINEEQPPPGEEHYRTSAGKHEPTISTGPSYQSQREEANNFVDLLVQNIATLPIDPAKKSRLLSLSIGLKQLGALGDEMRKVLDGAEDGGEPLPPAAMQKLEQMNQEMQQAHAFAQELQAELQKLKEEKAGKVVDNQFRLEIEKLKAETQIVVAEIGAKNQELQTRMKMEQETWKHLHGTAHDVATGEVDRQHEAEQAEKDRQQAAAQQQTDLEAQAEQEAAQPVEAQTPSSQ